MTIWLSLALAVQPAPPATGPASTAATTPGAIVEAAPAAAWLDVAPDRLLVMDLANGGRVVIALSDAFAAPHVANIVRLARAHWWDATSINRVQDDYVAQWGDATERKPVPPGVTAPSLDYARPLAGTGFRAMPYRDSYAAAVGHARGWAVAATGTGAGALAWLPHCYGSVGVGRNLAPDTGTGAELYAVIGHAPRQLDRNIAVVGRVLAGMERLSALPRGTGDLGFYTDPAERLTIRQVRLASELPPAERPAWQIMDTRSATFAQWLRVRANRHDDFYERPAGGVDICNAVPPARATPAAAR